MAQVQVQSVEHPFDESPDLLRRSLRVLFLTEAMGLIPERLTVGSLDRGSFTSLLGWLGGAGIGDWSTALAEPAWQNEKELLALVWSVEDALEESPNPATEWISVALIFDDDRLCYMLGISEASLRRYVTGARKTPDAVASRLHFLIKLIADLKGSYNDIGVRNWFVRRRQRLGDRSPSQVLAGDWDPLDDDVQVVREMAGALTSLPAT